MKKTELLENNHRLGSAVGRTDFWEPLVRWRAKKTTRDTAVVEIARYRAFVEIFEQALVR